MQNLFMAAATAAAIAVAAGPAAARFSPDNVNFSGAGPFGVVQGQVGGACTMTIKGSVKKKTGKITNATFSACSGGMTVTATGLPWAIKISGDDEVTLSDFGFSGFGAFCGPGTLTVAVTSTWTYSVANFPPGNCLLNGNWTLSPPITTKMKQ